MENLNFSLDIGPLGTAKTKVKQRPLMEKNVLPRHPSSVIFNGSSGSGKSNLLCTLLKEKHLLGGYFDYIHLISPTGCSDDMFEHLDLKPENIHTELNPKHLEDIMEKQKELVESKGIEKAPKILVILEDCQSNQKFLKSKPVLNAFVANRHYGMSTWLCSQYFNLTVKACRLQANCIYFFKGSGSETQIVLDEFCPPNFTKKEFAKVVEFATREKYNFLQINMRASHDKRYRKNLKEIINLDHFKNKIN